MTFDHLRRQHQTISIPIEMRVSQCYSMRVNRENIFDNDDDDRQIIVTQNQLVKVFGKCDALDRHQHRMEWINTRSDIAELTISRVFTFIYQLDEHVLLHDIYTTSIEKCVVISILNSEGHYCPSHSLTSCSYEMHGHHPVYELIYVYSPFDHTNRREKGRHIGLRLPNWINGNSCSWISRVRRLFSTTQTDWMMRGNQFALHKLGNNQLFDWEPNMDWMKLMRTINSVRHAVQVIVACSIRNILGYFSAILASSNASHVVCIRSRRHIITSGTFDSLRLFSSLFADANNIFDV